MLVLAPRRLFILALLLPGMVAAAPAPDRAPDAAPDGTPPPPAANVIPPSIVANGPNDAHDLAPAHDLEARRHSKARPKAPGFKCGEGLTLVAHGMNAAGRTLYTCE